MPVSRITLVTQIEFDPDIGGVSAGSMMMKPSAAAGFTAGTSRLVQQEAAQRPVLRDVARLLPQRAARRRGDPADHDVADFSAGMAIDDLYIR